ncbi:ABC transporter ATP-binding protein [Lacimicrobium alkaliphilum]|uniref:ABC transporter ATP-binding protein n=1 Tax=Lacimicrobium alkaliphilum TaxID=1526571 RepID=A0ABQ1RGZ8_9ALTE|nr:ATP-binding cassette domain-containing protein [Lacimicrobium alkaliphilum]GGD70093.1 ABC transporter ATP-binding protein [Lacimicrobium alkaliphilum]
MLTFNQVSQSYPHQSLLRNLSITIDARRALISGPNGCGKTTLLLLAAGLLKPQQGKITFNQQDVLLAGSKQSIGISASKVALPAFMPVKELLRFHAQQFGCEDDQGWVAEFGLGKFLLTKVQDLSLGNYKKLSLITALMHQPDLLILDEPGNGLDDQARIVLAGILDNYPGQIIVASHDNLSSGNTEMQHIPLQDIANGVM